MFFRLYPQGRIPEMEMFIKSLFCPLEDDIYREKVTLYFVQMTQAYIKYYDQSVLFSEILFHECLKKLKSLTKTTTRKITLLIVYCVPNTGYTVCCSNPTTNSHSSQYFLHFKSRKADVQRVQVTYAIPQSTDIL